MDDREQIDFEALRRARLEREERLRRIDEFHAERRRANDRCEHGTRSLCPECSDLR